MPVYQLKVTVVDNDNSPMISISHNDIDYSLIANMYKKDINNSGHGHGIQVNENINDDVALRLCDEISDVILKHTKKLFKEGK